MTKQDLRMILEYIALDEKLTRKTRSEKFAAAIIMWLDAHAEDLTTEEVFDIFDTTMADIVQDHNLQLN